MTFCLTATLFIVAACSPVVSPGGVDSTDSGIEGYITAGPACPAVQIDVPCPDRPYAGTLTILAENGRTKVAEVTAEAAGYYKVAVAPGTYIVHPESPGVLPRGTDVIVVVVPHRFTRQDIVYDTGIR